MMIQAAGGPGVHPIDFGERRKPIPKWVIGAVAASALLHLGGGAWLYFQRYETAAVAPPDDGPIITVDFFNPPPPPQPQPQTSRPAPPAPVHNTPQRPTTMDPLPATPSDTATPNDGPTVSLQPTEHSIPGGTGSGTLVEPTPPPVIVRPDWVRKPSGDQLMRAYPAAAIRTGATGAVTLNCAVRVDGTLTDCGVRSETPSGLGFGRAAMSLSRYFRMSPQSVNGQAVDGARVNVTTRFTLPED